MQFTFILLWTCENRQQTHERAICGSRAAGLPTPVLERSTLRSTLLNKATHLLCFWQLLLALSREGISNTSSEETNQIPSTSQAVRKSICKYNEWYKYRNVRNAVLYRYFKQSQDNIFNTVLSHFLVTSHHIPCDSALSRTLYFVSAATSDFNFK